MRRRWLSVAVGAVVTAQVALVGPGSAVASSPQHSHSKDGRVVEAYFADWDVYGANYNVKDIPANQVTHLLYAFATPTADGTCGLSDPWADYQRPIPADLSVDGVADDTSPTSTQKLFGNFNQLLKVKATHPHLKVLISIGGWSLSKYFSDVAATPQSRATFARSCVDTFINGDMPGAPDIAKGVFDGIDIDWEYPAGGGDPGNHASPADRHNVTLLFRELRHQLDLASTAQAHQEKNGRSEHYLLTAALPAGGVRPAASYELGQVAKVLDWANIMTYDFNGAWSSVTNFSAPTHSAAGDPSPPAEVKDNNVVGTIALYERSGFPASRLVVGVPFYGHEYQGVADKNHGLFQPFDTAASAGTPTYRDIVANDTAAAGFHRYVDNSAREPWLYSATANGGTMISYEDEHSVWMKANFVLEHHLRGAMVWEISQDSANHSLIGSLSRPLLGVSG